MVKIQPGRWLLYLVPSLLLMIFLLTMGKNGLLGLPQLLTALIGLLSLFGMWLLWRDVRGKEKTLTNMLAKYFVLKVVRWLGQRQRSLLEADTHNVQKVQEEILLKRLRKNADTLYGQRYDFKTIEDCETFRRRHPLTVYEHYGELVKRVSAGEDAVLTAERPHLLAMTSGTSGESRMLLRTKDTTSEFFFQGVSVCLEAMNRTFPATRSLQLTTKFFHDPDVRQSVAGIPVGWISCSLASFGFVLNLRTTPAPAFHVQCEHDILYLHLLFALAEPGVGMLESDFTSSIFYAFRVLQEWWEELVEDIELGRVSARLNLEGSVRKSLEQLLGSNPARAAQLHAEFERGFQGIALRLWPRLNLVLAVDSGSSHIYGDMLRRCYCEGVAFYSPFYAATEGLVGVNLWPEQQQHQYLLCPRSMFCEFVPEDRLDEEQPDTLFIDQLQEGQSYELVVTNASGLYRYRIGDVVKVAAFYNQCPVVEFQYRRGQMLNVRGEKISEAVFLGSLKRAVSLWPGAVLLDYCCVESSILGQTSGWSDPHYQVFLELKGVRNLTEEQRYKLDHCLQEDSAIYKSFRFKGSIGPMRLQLVGKGAFWELRDIMVASSCICPNTFKMPRVLRRKEYADFLLRKVIS